MKSMSKIDDLIKKLCPDGVSVRSLGDLEDSGIIKLGRGMVISKNDIADNPGDYPVYSSSATGLGEFGRYSKYMFDDERITWSVDGGGRFFHRKTHKYSVTNVSGWIKVNDANIITKYLYYVLDNLWLTKKFDYVKKAHPSVIRNEYKIPIPPLEVQKEIVRVLDSFTELEARKKQYEYYRNTLLTFNERENKIDDLIKELCPKGIKYERIKDVYSRLKGTPITAGKMKEIANPDGDIRVFAGGRTVIDAFEFDIPNANITKVPAVLVQSRGVIDVVYYDKPFTFKNEMWAYTHNNQDSIKYLYYVLKNHKEYLRNAASGMGSLPQISLKVTEELKIPIPPLEKQKQIVSILDKFDALVNDISIGLPAEIEARRKQYEYYRNKLLTFKELERSK